jgi:hypothetical protein
VEVLRPHIEKAKKKKKIQNKMEEVKGGKDKDKPTYGG